MTDRISPPQFHYRKEQEMGTAVEIDPRQLAATLGVDLLTLGNTFRQWADQAMSQAEREAGIPEDIYADGNDLERFDAYVTEARAHLEAAVAVDKAWREDNPDAFTEPNA